MKRTRAAMGHTAWHHVGDDTTTNPPAASSSAADLLVPGLQLTDTTATIQTGEPASVWAGSFARIVRVAIVGAAAYHGYKRNNSVGWAIGWGLLAGFSPPITLGIAIAEGFGKPRSST